jgi:hypothetical protein
MITYKNHPSASANNYPALIVGNRLQMAITYLHNTNNRFGSRGITIKRLDAVHAEAATLWGLLWTEFDGIDNTEAHRLRNEIRNAYENAVIRLRAKRGQTTTA